MKNAAPLRIAVAASVTLAIAPFAAWAADAKAVVDSSSDVALAIAALREMARWYDADQARPAQLAVWRRLRWIGQKSGSIALEREAGAMVRALVIVAGGSDAVTSPPRSDAFRSTVARAERRSGP